MPPSISCDQSPYFLSPSRPTTCIPAIHHKLHLLLSSNRAETIDVLDAQTNAVLDSRTASSFQNGQYLVWNLSGHAGRASVGGVARREPCTAARSL
jgi:hypothetical protein